MKAKELRAWLIILALNLIVVFACVWDSTHRKPIETEDEWIEETEDVIRWRFDEVEEEVIVELLESETVSEPVLQSLGEFKLTAYCSCKKCCGKWADIRPFDENGNPIVYGASGAILQAGRSIAVDPNVIPYGTVLIINGNEYIAEDCGIKGNKIDVYFDNHEDAKKFGVQYAEVFIKESN